MAEKHEFSKYERARVLGARSLQISMDAPLLMKMEGEELENLHFDPLKIAERELDSGVLPITVNRPMPIRREEQLKELKVEEVERERVNPESVDETAGVADDEEEKAEVVDLKAEEEIEDEEGEVIGDITGGSNEDSESDE